MRRKGIEYFIDKAEQIHGDRYNYSKVVYVKSKQKVTITCHKHGDFLQTPNSHLQGQGCAECGKEGRGGHKSLDLRGFIKRSNEIHGGKYDYSKVVYKQAKDRVTITCPKHGDFDQIACVHYSGSGCPRCGIDATGKQGRMSKSEFIERARERHGDLYSYESSDYQNTTTKMEIVCRKHGKFWATPICILVAVGCNGCSREGVIGINMKPFSYFLEKARAVHGDKYDYSRVNYEGCSKKMDIVCPSHGLFKQSGNKHMAGQGCPECMLGYRSEHIWHYPIYFSKTETSYLYVLSIETKLGESMLKIGLSMDPDRRAKQMLQSGDIIKADKLGVFEGLGDDVRRLESHLLRELKAFRYTPIEKFQGFTECLEYKALQKVLSKIETSGFELEDVTHEYI